MGGSGSGKSTVAALITRLYDPSSGHLLPNRLSQGLEGSSVPKKGVARLSVRGAPGSISLDQTPITALDVLELRRRVESRCLALLLLLALSCSLTFFFIQHVRYSSCFISLV